jgi:nucleoside-diphosphate-sugar epimerase
MVSGKCLQARFNENPGILEKIMDELVAITGGAGFIGSHLAEGFVRNGYSVRVIDNLTTGSWANLVGIENQIERQRVDIRDLKALTESFRNVSVVLHHAGMSSVPRSFEDRGYTHEVNVSGTLNVLLAAASAGVRKVINASSSSVYGNGGLERQCETATPSPLSPYGLSKWMTELYAVQFARTAPVETISFRYFNVFGPRQNLNGSYTAVIPQFIRRIAQGAQPIIFGDGTQTRNFTFIANIVEANLRAVQATVPAGAVINVATGSDVSLNELVRVLNEIFDAQTEPAYEPERPGDIKHSRADIAQSEKLLGDYNVEPFREGLEKTVQWFLQSDVSRG